MVYTNTVPRSVDQAPSTKHQAPSTKHQGPGLLQRQSYKLTECPEVFDLDLRKIDAEAQHGPRSTKHLFT